MNADIANIIKSRISSLNFVDRITGLVRPVRRIDIIEDQESGAQMPVVKVFPVACEVTNQECWEQSRYIDLVPNSERRSILYFEDRGIINLGKTANLFRFRSLLRLVCWLNLDMFDTSECSVSAPVSAAILNQLPTSSFNDTGGVYQRIQVQAVSFDPKTPAVFGGYSYSEETNQYLLYPYDYFALNLDTDFAIHENCINSIAIKAKEC